MTLESHRLVVGYHGCDRSVAEAVLVTGHHLEPSDNTYDWLGRGIYFWEHGPHRARQFAEWKQRRGKLKEPAVIGAYIKLGACFDLTDTQATKLLAGFYDGLVEAFRVTERQMPENRPAKGHEPDDLTLRELDCAVLNFGLEDHYQTVRGVFVEGEPAYPGAAIRTQTHVQIAVRDPACILGYFRVPE
ncbi:MAG: hypothetical protein H6724_10260 [Sandaracinus sp.]|nr:hypothetical protein [Sandaracinus sp.]